MINELENYLIYADIQAANEELIRCLKKVNTIQLQLNQLEIEKALSWAELRKDPEFKPGRSTADMVGKLIDAYPDFMETVRVKEVELETVKVELDVARAIVSGQNALMRLNECIQR